MRLLLVEDHPELGRRLSGRLRAVNFVIDLATTRESAEAWPDLDKFSAIVLDLGLPDSDGMQLLRHWRAQGVDCPVLILTARGSWQDKVEGLNAGADDFVVKPVRFEELLARLNALMRRRIGMRDNVLEAGGVRLETVGRCASIDGAEISLSRQEYRLLYLLMSRAGQILTQADMLEHLYDLGEERDQNAVEVQISRLRRKIGRERIVTVRGLGYRFAR